MLLLSCLLLSPIEAQQEEEDELLGEEDEGLVEEDEGLVEDSNSAESEADEEAGVDANVSFQVSRTSRDGPTQEVFVCCRGDE